MAAAKLPVVLPCTGTPESGARAAEVAAGLAGRGLAEVVDDVEQVVAAARDGRTVLALDGCAGSCQARLLDAAGVRSLRALNLSGPGATGVEVAKASSVEALAAAATPLRRTRRAPALAAQSDERRSHSLDDYLLALDALTASVVECGAVADAPTLTAHVARLLGVSRAAAGEMVVRLEDEGLVRRGERKELLLTAAGRTAADRLLRAKRVLECFAVDSLGYSIAECHGRARELTLGFDDEAVERVWAALGRPERCPHGRPLDPVRARESARELLALSAVRASGLVTVDRLEEGSRERLAALADAGIAPGVRLAEVTADPAAETVSFLVAGERRSIGGALADAVLVR
jgi:DtxR family Mn-dependent transcriptional regulator